VNLLTSITLDLFDAGSFSPLTGIEGFCRVSILSDNQTAIVVNGKSQLFGLLNNIFMIYSADTGVSSSFPVLANYVSGGFAPHFSYLAACHITLQNDQILVIQPDSATHDANTLFVIEYANGIFNQVRTVSNYYNNYISSTDSVITIDLKTSLNNAFIFAMTFVIKE
jgi:hypothetical protein